MKNNKLCPEEVVCEAVVMLKLCSVEHFSLKIVSNCFLIHLLGLLSEGNFVYLIIIKLIFEGNFALEKL